MIRDDEPIAALSTAPGSAALAVVRVSGRGSHQLLSRVLRLKQKPAARRMVLAKFINPDDDLVLDEPLVAFFHGPASFTGQDSAEIHCHGSPWIVQKILTALFQVGFRQADPGEFTRRAFLHGKLDLTAAEGIRELVQAQSHQQWVAARQLATGQLRSLAEDLRAQLVEAMAWLEARIDFPDEGDTSGVDLQHVDARVARVGATLDRLEGSYLSGRVASSGLMVALYGLPNAGKSTLMNALLGHERAIVSPVAGTTRDWIEERCLIHGRFIRLVDMAGVREGADAIEAIGVAKSRQLATEADVVIHLMAADVGLDQHQIMRQWLSSIRGKNPVLECLTKTDLASPDWAKGSEILQISAKTGDGLDTLKNKLSAMVDRHVDTVKEDVCISTPRHLNAVRQARAALAKFHEARKLGAWDEMLAFELLEAARALENLVGRVSGDDVLGKIFADFCIGK